MVKYNYWTPEETRILTDNYSKLPLKELQKLLPNREIDRIRYKAHSLGLKKRDHQSWTAGELDFLKENYKKMPVKELQKVLRNRSEGAIRTKAKKLGLSSSRDPLGTIINLQIKGGFKVGWLEE